MVDDIQEVFRKTHHSRMQDEMLAALLSLTIANCKTLPAKGYLGPVPTDYENIFLIRQKSKSIRAERTPQKYMA